MYQKVTFVSSQALFGLLRNCEFFGACVFLTPVFFVFLCSGIKLMECNLDKKVSIDNFIEINYIILICRWNSSGEMSFVGELQLWQLQKRGLKNFSFNVIQTHVCQILVECYYKLYLRATGWEWYKFWWVLVFLWWNLIKI